MQIKNPGCRVLCSRDFCRIISVILSGKKESVHDNKMACASTHNKQMENLMTPEVFVPIIKERQLQCVDNAACGINNAPGQEPAECRGRHIVEDLSESQDTGPAHPNVENGRYPFRTVYPECLDQNARDSNRPHNGKQDDPGLSFENDEADRSIASGDQHRDHHVVDLL